MSLEAVEWSYSNQLLLNIYFVSLKDVVTKPQKQQYPKSKKQKQRKKEKSKLKHKLSA